MSSPRRTLITLALAALVALGGCTIRPLYGTTSGESGPQSDLPAINVQEPTWRAELTISLDASDAEVEKAALALEPVQKLLEGRPPRRVVVVPNRIVNVVA